jgi:hypothetical protein
MPTLRLNADLIKTFNAHATEMLDIRHLHKVIQDGMETDIQKHDFVITTKEYDSSIFVCDPLIKQKARQRTELNEHGVRAVRHYTEEIEMLNPYTERVVDTALDSRVKMTVKADKADTTARDERRVKVRKLNLLSWDEDKNEYPRQSEPIIFRQKMVSFNDIHQHRLRYYENLIATRPEWVTPAWMREAEAAVPLLRHLISIPPFLAYADEKYGFLVKRRLAMSRIVLNHGWRGGATYDAKNEAKKQIETDVAVMVAKAEARVPDGDLSFRETVVKEAMKPERVETLVDKHGVDGAEASFTAAVVAVVPPKKGKKGK